MFRAGDDLLMVATDRISAFDCVLPNAIPGKGRVLTQLSLFWFRLLEDVVPNHLITDDMTQVEGLEPGEAELLQDRALLVRKAEPLPVEFIVRGYLAGSGWNEYQQQQSVCGIKLPAGLQLADKLPEPLFTPSTKAEAGEHDENISYEVLVEHIGSERAAQIRDASLALYQFASKYSLEHGIIIADTKFEFGVDQSGKLHLVDEALTPDSSRFWPLDSYQPGSSPVSFDKQYIRDWLESTQWNKAPPAPTVPDDIVRQTREKYNEAYRRLTGKWTN